MLKHSISYFRQLADQFLAHFATSRTHKKTSTFLINIKWGKDESLKSYITKFIQVDLEIKYLSLVVAMHFILVRLRSKDFFKSLAKKLTKIMIKLLAKLAKFINMEGLKKQKPS